MTFAEDSGPPLPPRRGIESRAYLCDVMRRISVESDVAKLTPHGWRTHFLESATKVWEALVAKLSTAPIPTTS